MTQPTADRVRRTRVVEALTMLSMALRLTFSVKYVAVGLVGLLATTGVWHLSGVLFLPESATSSDHAFHARATSWRGDLNQRWEVFPGRAAPIDPVVGVPYRFVEPFRRLFVIGQSRWSLLYYLVGGLGVTVIWALLGALVSRLTVVRLGCHRTLPMRDALHFALHRWPAYFAAPMLSLVGIVMLAFPIFVLGWFMRYDVGVFVAGFLWMGVLFAGVLMALLSLGLLFGWPLMWGAISSEDGDSFDAISRAYAYTLQQPLPYLGYLSVAAVLGLAGWGVVWWLSEAVVELSFWAVSLSAGSERINLLVDAVRTPGGNDSPLWRTGAGLIGWAVNFTYATASGFAFSYFWSASAAIYLLIRRSADATPLDQVTLEQEVPPTSTRSQQVDISEPAAE